MKIYVDLCIHVLYRGYIEIFRRREFASSVLKLATCSETALIHFATSVTSLVIFLQSVLLVVVGS